jgi:AraC-like DNA-binding protein
VIGQTFTVWLHTLRIEESKLLLNDSAKMPIEEVGKRVGIDELYNFSRWFKIITGVSPQQYRKQNNL